MLAPFGLRQELFGSLTLAEGRDRPLPIGIWLASTRRWVLPPRSAVRVEGRLHAPPLATHAQVTGLVDLRALSTHPDAHRLEFQAADGRRLTLSARRLSARTTPLMALSTVAGTLRNASGAELGQVELRHDYRQRLADWLVH